MFSWLSDYPSNYLEYTIIFYFSIPFEMRCHSLTFEQVSQISNLSVSPKNKTATILRFQLNSIPAKRIRECLYGKILAVKYFHWQIVFVKKTSQTEKSFRKLIKSNRNQIVFTLYLLIWNQTDVRLDPNQSENGKYNLISLWFNKISKRFVCVHTA